MAESTSSDKYDDRRDIGLTSEPNPQSGAGMQNNPNVVKPTNPANPSDPSGITSNTPGTHPPPPPSVAPGTNTSNTSPAPIPSRY